MPTLLYTYTSSFIFSMLNLPRFIKALVLASTFSAISPDYIFLCLRNINLKTMVFTKLHASLTILFAKLHRIKYSRNVAVFITLLKEFCNFYFQRWKLFVDLQNSADLLALHCGIPYHIFRIRTEYRKIRIYR